MKNLLICILAYVFLTSCSGSRNNDTSINYNPNEYQNRINEIKRLDSLGIKDWTFNEMFNDEISSEANFVKDAQIDIDIRAFKHKFHSNLDSTWVLGYVHNGKETLPGPNILAEYGEQKTVKFILRRKFKMTLIWFSTVIIY